MLLLYFPHFPSESSRFFLDGPGLGQLLTYAGITILACIGYGAFFLVVGLFFRNPIIPAIVLYGWEWLNFLMPPLLKKISVIHYLQFPRRRCRSRKDRLRWLPNRRRPGLPCRV